MVLITVEEALVPTTPCLDNLIRILFYTDLYLSDLSTSTILPVSSIQWTLSFTPENVNQSLHYIKMRYQDQ